MINRAAISREVEKILREGTEGYTIIRNDKRNEDPNIAAQGKGWVGIYRGKTSYRKASTGPNPWAATIDQVVEIQVASMTDGGDVEDRIQAAEDEIISVLTRNQNLNGTVNSIREVEVEDELNVGTDVYHQAVIITIRAEART